MHEEINYNFDELCLVQGTHKGKTWNYSIDAAGTAVIGYDENGEWWVEEIYIDATRQTKKPTTSWDRNAFKLPPENPMFVLIQSALYRDCSEYIRDAIARCDNAPVWSPQEEHGTLNRAQQGV